MTNLNTFAPEHLTEDAKRSGFFQCPTCGLIWFGRADIQECPQAPHGRPVHVAILCRICDAVIPLEQFAHHLVHTKHNFQRKLGSTMACEEYETLNHDWQVKFRAEISAHDGYKGTVKAVLAERSRTNSARITAENRLMNHIKDCIICQTEGRRPSEVDTHQPFH